MIENSIFCVWKEVSKTQRVIWCGQRSNFFFRKEATRVYLPTPDLIFTMCLPSGSSPTCRVVICISYLADYAFPAFAFRSWGYHECCPRTLILTQTRDACSRAYRVCRSLPVSGSLSRNASAPLFSSFCAATPCFRLITSRRSHPGLYTGFQIPYLYEINMIRTSSKGANISKNIMQKELWCYGLPTEELKDLGNLG